MVSNYSRHPLPATKNQVLACPQYLHDDKYADPISKHRGCQKKVIWKAWWANRGSKLPYLKPADAHPAVGSVGLIWAINLFSVRCFRAARLWLKPSWVGIPRVSDSYLPLGDKHFMYIVR